MTKRTAATAGLPASPYTPGRNALPSSSTNKKAKPSPSTTDIINDTNKAYQDAEADIVLISADGLKFRVHGYHLMSASSVFRQMIAVGNKDISSEVQLTDKEFEKSITVKLFLDIVYGKTIETPKCTPDLNKYFPLVKFVSKFESRSVLASLQLALRSWTFVPALSPAVLFLLGCECDDDEATHQTIKMSFGWKGLPNEKDAEGNALPNHLIKDGIENASIFDLTASPWVTFKSIPTFRIFALLRASRKYPSMAPTKDYERWKEVADEYKKVIDIFRNENLI